MKSELKSYSPMKAAGFGFRHKVIVAIRGLMDGPRHKGGVLPLGTIESPVAQIAHLTNERLQQIAASWNHYEHSIPSAMRQADIELQIAREDLKAREDTLAAHIGEYRRTHDGLVPPAVGSRSIHISTWLLFFLFALAELPLTGAAFTQLLPTDWEKLIATLGASAVIICLSHQIGISFATPAKTVGQRAFGLLMILVLFVILATLSIIRVEAVKKHLKTPARSVPEVRFELQKGERFNG